MRTFKLKFLGLALGELAKSNSFHLGEAMSAIEIMDPKMDAGMIPMEKDLGLENAIKVTFYYDQNFQFFLFIMILNFKTGKLNYKDMPLPELIATMDATLSSIVTWLHAQPLDQTVIF